MDGADVGYGSTAEEALRALGDCLVYRHNCTLNRDSDGRYSVQDASGGRWLAGCVRHNGRYKCILYDHERPPSASATSPRCTML